MLRYFGVYKSWLIDYHYFRFMLRYLLTLLIAVTSLVGPTPCCCTFAFARPASTTVDPGACCCCCQPVESAVSHSTNSSSSVASPSERCRCDRSRVAEPATIVRTEIENCRMILVGLVSDLALPIFQLATCQAGLNSHFVPDRISGRALLRALQVMRC
jgi:hypothetical protein